MIRKIIGCSLIAFCLACNQHTDLAVSSPNGRIKVVLENRNGEISYNLLDLNQNVIQDSELSIFEGLMVKIVDHKESEVRESWNPVWGQFEEIQDHHNEMELSLKYGDIPANLLVRTYDDGVAFRFIVPEIPDTIRPTFEIEYGLVGKDQMYSPTNEHQPIGPIDLQDLAKQDSVEYKFRIPLLVEQNENRYLSFLESDLFSSPGFEVMNIEYDKNREKLISENKFTSDESSLVTPWRVILIEDKIGDLVTNNVALNVAAPNEITDPTWIKPGKTLWDWRVHGYQTEDGFTYGIDNESYFRFIDFAAANEIEYFLIDDAWYKNVEPGRIEMSDALDLDKVTRYANEKGVSLLLYYDRKHGNYGDQALFPYYKSLDMKGIKYGFMGRNVPFTRNAIKLSAESNLIIDFHDNPVPFTGVSRTFPNAITREFCHAQQDSRRAFTQKSFIRMALINALQGPLDMNNGVFDITGVNLGERDKGPRKLNSLVTTVTAEAARTLIIFSGLVCIPDSPEAYTSKQDLFEFIKEMPVGQWDESIVIQAKMDGYITTARRHEDEWFIGSVHNQGGTLDIPLDFLKEEMTYVATFYEDSAETDATTNPEAYQVRSSAVKKGDVIKAKMAASSGHCIWIKPEKIE